MWHSASIARLALAALALALACSAGRAQVAQVPLLGQSAAVDPNLVLMFDDSTSMLDAFLYGDGRDAMWGGTGSTRFDQHGVSPPTGRDTYARCSPQVNRIAYDPAKRYVPRQNHDGSIQAAGDVATAFDNAPCKTNIGGRDYPTTYVYLGQPRRYDLASSYATPSYVISPALTFARSPARTDCAGSSCTFAEEAQNYANWYTYYGTRIDMAKTALSQAFATLPANLRIGWSRINTLGSIYSDTLGNLDAGVAPYDASTRQRLFTWLHGITIGNANFTTSRKAFNAVGRYFSRSDSDGPWGTQPNPASVITRNSSSPLSLESPSAHATCRRSHTMLITDGYYNDYQDHPFSFAEVDDVTGPTITGPNGRSWTYSPQRPFRSNSASSMADVAMSYWGRDLRPDLDNTLVPVANRNPAFWQHLNFHAITLGLEGTLPQTASTLAALTAGTRNWPAPPTQNAAEAIDDIWHATINGRGKMINANDGGELSSALQDIVDDIMRASTSQAGVAASTVNLVSGTLKFVPIYVGGSWGGNLRAMTLDPATGAETGTAWQVETLDRATGIELANTLGSPGSRNIYVGTRPGSSARAVAFDTAAMTSQSLDAVVGSAFSAQLVDYLRGERSLEGSVYRRRSTALGDIVNSAPTFVRPAIDYGYANLPGIGSTYASYLAGKKAMTTGAVFVGSNDGMLHAFSERDGSEIFAYMPFSVLPTIAEFASRNYSHRFYVDGPLTQGDFHAGGWRTAVVGTTGAGAKAVFAIDATQPARLSDTSVLWEVSTAAPGFEELGHVLESPSLGYAKSGDWIAVFGNGYASASGSAQLFVVNLANGRLLARLDTGVGGGNGLGGVRLVLDARQQVVGAYAGDLKGNLWKFDLSDPSPANWRIAMTGRPLYTARAGATAQPITASPAVIPHPQGGYVVTFGTGKLFEGADRTTTGVQTAYGIRDRILFGAGSTGGSPIAGTSTLVLQSITTTATVSRVVSNLDGATFTRVVSYYKVGGNPVDWNAKDGWYLPLPNSGQRVIYPVNIVVGRLVQLETVVPPPAAADPCSATGATGYNYLIDPLSGGSPAGSAYAVTDANGQTQRIEASGNSSSADGRNVVFVTGAPGGQRIIDCSADATCERKDVPCASTGLSCNVRQSWRQLFLR